MNQATTSTIHKAAGGNPDTGAVEAVPTLTQVYEAIRQLHEAGEEPTRDRIHKMTGLNLTTVDDRIKVLRGEGMISAVKQCYRPVHQHGPARAVTVTHLTDRGSILEVGEHVIHFTRTEGAMVGQAYAGLALEHTALARVTELQDQLLEEIIKRRVLERQFKSLKSKISQDTRQLDFISDSK
ncbi:hypothetical protein [Delftia tsuruhatensis]|uniref:Uncharacterized protein n=1 Tax=Delftia tsuruhatensis TaxID=180282 RepID=A0AAX3SH42_9BURK|nr:hypothetical protein [Delftia tsuruhatensis]WFF79308.1 hypothetical protein PYR84_20480 [Delftia tsuruhatensis]